MIMRTINPLKLLTAVLVGAVLALSVGPLDWTEAQSAPQAATAGSSIAWDHNGLDVAGQPETIAHYVVALTAPGGDPDGQAVKRANVTAKTAPVTQIFSGVANGTYDVRVQAVDAAGNESVWSSPLSVVWDNAAPTAPVNVRVTVSVEVNVSQ